MNQFPQNSDRFQHIIHGGLLFISDDLGCLCDIMSELRENRGIIRLVLFQHFLVLFCQVSCLLLEDGLNSRQILVYIQLSINRIQIRKIPHAIEKNPFHST